MTIARMIDLKHGINTDGKIVKVFSDGLEEELLEDEPVILFRARDRLALPLLHQYFEFCKADGATDYQLESMTEMIQRFQSWADENTTKQPGITKGLPWDGKPS